jgi:hypothetical protein
MGLFNRKISPDFIAVPAEAHDLAKQEADIDRINAAAYAAYQQGDMRNADRLLDMRLAIRPPRDPAEAPVAPGPDRFDEYWENPR